jgi:hypothetical protein
MEFTAQNNYWHSNAKIADTFPYVNSQRIGITLIGNAVLHQVSAGIMLYCSSSLRIHRDDIKSELIAICMIPEHIPITLHDKIFTYRYVHTGTMYNVITTGICIFTDKRHVDDMKDLLNKSFMDRIGERISIPKTCTILPCMPTSEVPREIHELMIVSHNKTVASMKQGVIYGVDWECAKIEREVNPDSVFGKQQPDITTISSVQLLAHSLSCNDSRNPIHCVSQTARGDLIINY